MTDIVELAMAVLAVKEIDLSKLSAPFPPEAVSWRVGSTTADKKKGLPLAYIDARDVMDRLDEVCGPGGWQRRYSHIGDKMCCEVGILINGNWIWKADGSDDTDFEATKGGFSDSFKRSAVNWGIGRHLYGISAPWVAIEPAGKSYKISENEMLKLRALLTDGQPAAVEKADKNIPAPPRYSNDAAFADFIKKTPRGPCWKTTAVDLAMRNFVRDLDGVTDNDELVELLADNDTALQACREAQPTWWNGKPGSDIPGIWQRIDEKRRLLKAQPLTQALRDSVQREVVDITERISREQSNA